MNKLEKVKEYLSQEGLFASGCKMEREAIGLTFDSAWSCDLCGKRGGTVLRVIGGGYRYWVCTDLIACQMRQKGQDEEFKQRFEKEVNI